MTTLSPERTAALVHRPRRLRRTTVLRELIAEHRVHTAQLIQPYFVHDSTESRRAVPSMPGVSQWSMDGLVGAVTDSVSAGVSVFMLFGVPSTKDADGTGAWGRGGPVLRALQSLLREHPSALLIADVCLCAYTAHGHCGTLLNDVVVNNDATVEALARVAVAYADAGADVVAPSAMMDGQVAAIRAALDDAGHQDVAILAYSAKYASALYGPFRHAAQSAPAFGDRRGYQMDPANVREALRAASLDVSEGADMVMVKPAGSYLDVVRAVRERVDVPVVAYQVSGEYAMIKAAAERGWLDERRAVEESLVSIRRAGADAIITYYATEVARWRADGHGH